MKQLESDDPAPNGQEPDVQYPLSADEHAAMMRYISGIRRQLQDVSDLFSTRYGKNSSIAEIAVKTLVSSTLLQHELLMHDSELRAKTFFEQERAEIPVA